MLRVEVRESSIGGLGVFAASVIPEGELIREYNLVREVTPAAPVDPEKGEALEHCTYPDDRIFLVGYPDRHFNHSCDPNAIKRFVAESIQLWSRRPIARGTEITHDYMINGDGGTRWKCNCGAKRCRGEAVPSFFDLSLPIQIEYRSYLASWFVRRHSEEVSILDREAHRPTRRDA